MGFSAVSAADVTVQVLGAIFIAPAALLDDDLVFEDPGVALLVHQENWGGFKLCGNGAVWVSECKAYSSFKLFGIVIEPPGVLGDV